MNRMSRRAALGGALAVLVLAASSADAQRRPAPRPTPTALTPAQRDSLVERADASRMKGAPDAPVMILEISDYQCPYCARFATGTLPALDSLYVKPGNVRFVFINYPIPSHRDAWTAAEAALCAGVQGRYWPMHDLLFARQREWSAQGLDAARLAHYAESIGLDSAAFRYCTETDLVAGLIVGDAMNVARAGIDGTPSFLLNGKKALSGAQPLDVFRREIDALLAEANTSTPHPEPTAPHSP